MSYDLLFRSKPGSPPITPESFRSHFNGREHYTLSETQAWYSNPDTGIYYSFELPGEPDPPDPDDPEADEYPREDAAFNLNYFRPHIFGLEAEPEGAAFMKAFDPLLEDPQTEGMADGTYSSAGFLRGWNHGNAVAYAAILSSGTSEADLHCLPTEDIESCWRWNRRRNAFQEEVGESIFVPRIMMMAARPKPTSFIVWTDGAPAYIPIVDNVVLFRDRFAPRRLLRRQQDTVLVPWAAIEALTSSFPRREGDRSYVALTYPDTPPAIARWVEAQPRQESLPKGLGIDSVLNLELLQEALARAT